jgi:predicted TIM-barrel fold metal-dependent hydrolase
MALPVSPTFPPDGACDCHFHVFGPLDRFPYKPDRSFTPSAATVEQYQALMRRLGLSRCVIVQPSVYGTDNACTEAALAALGDRARGVAVVPADVPEAEVARLDRAGFRGVRLNLLFKGGTSLDALERLAARLAPFRWHIQLLVDGTTLPKLAPRLCALPVPTVIDHMGHMPASLGADHPAFRALIRLLGEGHTWVKLSGAYRISEPPFSGAAPIARALLAGAPTRCVWGTDWPHPAYDGPALDDLALLQLVPAWTGDASTIRRLMVDNPAELYRF